MSLPHTTAVEATNTNEASSSTLKAQSGVITSVHPTQAAYNALSSLRRENSPGNVPQSQTVIPSISDRNDIFITKAPGNDTSAVDVRSRVGSFTQNVNQSFFVNNRIIRSNPTVSTSLMPMINEMVRNDVWHPNTRTQPTAIAPPHNARSLLHQQLTLLPLQHHLPAKDLVAARSSALREPFDTRQMSVNNFHSGQLLSEMAHAMDPYLAREHIAAIDRSALAARLSSNNLFYSSSMAALPSLPLPNRAIAAPNNKNFPEVLFKIVSSEEYAHIISWLPHGQGFMIHNKQQFANMILPLYFDGAKFTSFTRRLKRWNFVRVPRGPELGAYYNKNFVRGHMELVKKMKYQDEGKFENCKTNSKDQKEGEEHLEELESKVQEITSQKKALEEDPPIPSSKADNEPRGNQFRPPMVSSSELKTTSSSDTPSVSSKIPDAANDGDIKSSSLAVETPKDYPSTAAEPSPCSNVPMRKQTDNVNEQRLMEMHHEMTMARSVLSQIGLPNSPLQLEKESYISTHHCFPSDPRAQEKLHDDHHARVEHMHMLRTRHLIEQNQKKERLPSNIAASSKTNEKAVNNTMPNIQSTAAARSNRPESYNEYRQRELQEMSLPQFHKRIAAERAIEEARINRGGRAVMMSREEEEEFARFLALKRIAMEKVKM